MYIHRRNLFLDILERPYCAESIIKNLPNISYSQCSVLKITGVLFSFVFKCVSLKGF